MPNHCMNTVIIKSSNMPGKDNLALTKLEELYLALKDEQFFNHVIPMPEELNENGEWYEWRINNWSTKWEAYELDYVIYDNVVEVNFTTAWSPPIRVYDELVNMGFEVEAKYFEPGCDFVGEYIDGEDKTYTLENAPAHLVEFYEIEEYLDLIEQEDKEDNE